MGRRCIGLDVHREFAQVAVWENGRVRQAGKIGLTAEALRVFCDSLAAEDEVAIEATCNTHAIVRLIAPHVARVVVSNPQKTRAIAEAKVKTDKVDAAILAELLAADFLPSVWVADEGTHALRRQVARRANIVRQRTRLKNQVQAILQRNLIARCPAADLFGVKGRYWLAGQHLPADEELAVEALLRQIDFHAQELRIIDAALGRIALERDEVLRLMTIPRGRRDRRVVAGRRGGGLPALLSPRAAGLLSRAQPTRQAVRELAGQSREDHQARPRSRARDDGRGGVHRRTDSGPAARVL
jgi:transposase